MKLSPKQWCKIKEMLANLKCPNCFSAKIDLNEDEKGNAECKDCECKFDYNPELLSRQE